MRKIIFIIMLAACLRISSGEMIMQSMAQDETVSVESETEKVSPYSEGVACFIRDGKYGFMDETGQEVLPPIYDKACPFSEGLAYFEIGEKYGFMNKLGEEVFLLDCDSVSSFQEGRAYFSLGGKYGYIDQEGKQVIPPTYSDVGFFSDGTAEVQLNTYMGLIDLEGNELIAPGYDDIDKNGDIYKVSINENYGCFKDGNLIVPVEYDLIEIYDEIITCRSLSGKSILTDTDGNKLCETPYDIYEYIPELQCSIVRDDNYFYGIMNNSGEICVPLIYADIDYIEDMPNFFMVSKDYKTGFMDSKTLTMSIPLIYDYAYIAGEGIIVVLSGEYYGAVNTAGDLVIPVQYDWISVGDNGVMVVSKNGKDGLVASNGEILADVIYSHIEYMDSYYLAEINDEYVYFDLNGKQIEMVPEKEEDDSSQSPWDQDLDIYDYIWDEERIWGLGNPPWILRHEITPRLKCYYNYIKEQSANSTKEVVTYYRLYDLDGSGTPVLYEEALLKMYENTVYSGFYGIDGDKIKPLISSWESDKYTRRGAAFFIRNSVTEYPGIGLITELPPLYPSYYNMKYSVYTYKEGTITLTTEYSMVSRSTSNIDQKELVGNAGSYCDSYGTPLSADIILNYTEVWEPNVNGEKVSVEEYQKLIDDLVYISVGY